MGGGGGREEGEGEDLSAEIIRAHGGWFQGLGWVVEAGDLEIDPREVFRIYGYSIMLTYPGAGAYTGCCFGRRGVWGCCPGCRGVYRC